MSLEDFAVFQVYFYLKRLMRLRSDIWVPFTPPEPGWPSTDALMRDELKRARGGCIVKDQGQAAAVGRNKDIVSSRGAFEVGVLKLSVRPKNCLVSGDQFQQGTASCWAG